MLTITAAKWPKRDRRVRPNDGARSFSDVAETAARVVPLLLIGVLLLTTPLHAHLALRLSSPAAGERLRLAPTTLEFSFTEPIEFQLSTISLTGPGGVISLSDPEALEGNLLRAAITGELVAGSYTVQWQAVGLDGHPIRGEYSFVIEEGAEGLAIADTAVALGFQPDPMTPPVPAEPQLTFSAQSPLYAGVRWLTYFGILGLVGSIGFGLLLSSARVGQGDLPTDFRAAAITGAAGLGLLASALFLISLPLRLQAQSQALFGAGITAERFGLVLSSLWGRAWSIQAAGIVVALVGLLLVRRLGNAAWVVAAVGALVIALTLGMSGHAASVRSLTILAIASDGLHVLGVGVWLGTLLALMLVALPLVRKLAPPERGPVLYQLISAFSPLALGAAAVVAATGLFASYLHLTSPTDLWSSTYGRVLFAKLLLVGIVVAAGAYNWRRLLPDSGAVGADRRLRSSAGIELIAAMLILGLTSFLVAVPPPADAFDVAAQNPSSSVEK